MLQCQYTELTKRDLDMIRENLPDGWDEILAGLFKLSVQHIRNIIGGRRKNRAVIRKAIQMAIENLKEDSKLITEFKNLVQK